MSLEPDWLELVALPVRARANGLARSDGALAALANAELAVQLEERARTSEDERASRLLWRGLALSPTLEVLEALLAGGEVPADRLDERWARRFGVL